jgi:hypothetical protein
MRQKPKGVDRGNPPFSLPHCPSSSLQTTSGTEEPTDATMQIPSESLEEFWSFLLSIDESEQLYAGIVQPQFDLRGVLLAWLCCSAQVVGHWSPEHCRLAGEP